MTLQDSSTDQSSIVQPRVSVGIPVYNGEKFIRKKLESMLAQTFINFELIISDNASTDSTPKICEEYSKKDKRIRYIRQKMHRGAYWNYEFVLKEAKYEYFLWTAVDEVLLPNFLEKNINVLESNKNVSCSISRIKMYGEFTDYLTPSQNDSFLTKLEKKIKTNFSHMDSYAATGPYEKRVKTYLKTIRHNQIFYGVYRTNQLRDCIVHESFLGMDAAITLNILKYGELYVVDEILMYVYDGGISRSGMIGLTRQINNGFFGIIFPFYPFSRWCVKHLGIRFFLKNFTSFIKLNFVGVFSFSVDFVRRGKSIVRKKLKKSRSHSIPDN